MPKVGARGAVVTAVANRRSQEEIGQLVVIFKHAIRVSKHGQQRVAFFWPTNDILEELLQKLARDTPLSADPLQADGGDANFEDEDDVMLLDAEGGSRAGGSRCVNWLGLTNRDNGHAAVSTALPATYEPWVTYVNRLIAFLFADLPDGVLDNFDGIIGAKPGEPLRMLCGNPR